MRQHLLSDAGHAAPDLRQVALTGGVSQQLAEELDGGGAGPQGLRLAGLVGEPLMRKRQGDEVGDPPPNHQIDSGVTAWIARVETEPAEHVAIQADRARAFLAGDLVATFKTRGIAIEAATPQLV